MTDPEDFVFGQPQRLEKKSMTRKQIEKHIEKEYFGGECWKRDTKTRIAEQVELLGKAGASPTQALEIAGEIILAVKEEYGE